MLYRASASGLIHTAYVLPLFLPYTHPGVIVGSPSALTITWFLAAAATFSSTYWNLGFADLACWMPSNTDCIDCVASLLLFSPAATPLPHGVPLLNPWHVLSSVHAGDAHTAASSGAFVRDILAAHRTSPPSLSLPLWNFARISGRVCRPLPMGCWALSSVTHRL